MRESKFPNLPHCENFTATILAQKFRQITFFTKELYSKIDFTKKKDLRVSEFLVFPHCVCPNAISRLLNLDLPKLISRESEWQEDYKFPHSVFITS